MKDIKTISIKCETQDVLELAEMTEFQGGLKERTDIDYDKIKLSIIKYGFSFPFFVWKDKNKNWILDGHGRFVTLIKMQKDGYLIPPLPVVYVECKDVADAKNKLLRLNSTYGKMSADSVIEFIGDDIDIDEIKSEIILPEGVISFDEDNDEIENTDLSDKDISTFSLEIECSDEEEQEMLFNEFTERGLKCKVLTL